MIDVDSEAVALVGRVQERRFLDAAMASPEAELIAVYGRRRSTSRSGAGDPRWLRRSVACHRRE
jgi:hypothetical protein